MEKMRTVTIPEKRFNANINLLEMFFSDLANPKMQDQEFQKNLFKLAELSIYSLRMMIKKEGDVEPKRPKV